VVVATCKFDGGIVNCVTKTYDVCGSDRRSDSDALRERRRSDTQ
jgi:hypothetical protein